MSEVGPTIFVSAGEVSGDAHGAGVISALRQRFPDASFFGVGGDKMAAAGLELLAHVQALAVIGFAEVLRLVPLIYRTRQRILREITSRNPDLLILIDYPGFHLSLLRKVRKLQLARRPKVLYYISPQVWAWRAGRAKELASLADHIAVIFPFETNIYDEVGLPCTFVGHPLLDELEEIPPRGQFLKSLGLEPDDRVVALLPGSRQQEVRRHLPVMLASAAILKRFVPAVRFVVAQAPSLPRHLYEQLASEHSIAAISNQTHAILAHANSAWVKSGSGTMEAAYFGNPFVVIYRTSGVTYRLSKWVVKVPYIAMPNILAGEKVVTELVQRDATAERLASETVPFLLDSKAVESFRKRLKPVREALGVPGAAQRVADIAAKLIAS
ncbi:MAG: lipid-A-disaccharide synthase [bacterium]